MDFSINAHQNGIKDLRIDPFVFWGFHDNRTLTYDIFVIIVSDKAITWIKTGFYNDRKTGCIISRFVTRRRDENESPHLSRSELFLLRNFKIIVREGKKTPGRFLLVFLRVTLNLFLIYFLLLYNLFLF